jgi:hypothetical protein
MYDKIDFYLKGLECDGIPVTDEIISNVQKLLDFKLPEDYLYVVKYYNGGEGDVGEEGYIELFPFEMLIQINADYELLMKQIPDYYLFAKDAADTGFAFHKQNHTYHSFGLMSNFETDNMDFWGNSFLEFIDHLLVW